MLSVQTNMLAANASRQLGITTNKNAKSTEKLSSGYRINRAADDAAGLSISEKMRRPAAQTIRIPFITSGSLHIDRK